eukprot:12460207-Heterocapsa_arctica.AAC.1
MLRVHQALNQSQQAHRRASGSSQASSSQVMPVAMMPESVMAPVVTIPSVEEIYAQASGNNGDSQHTLPHLEIDGELEQFFDELEEQFVDEEQQAHDNPGTQVSDDVAASSSSEILVSDDSQGVVPGAPSGRAKAAPLVRRTAEGTTVAARALYTGLPGVSWTQRVGRVKAAPPLPPDFGHGGHLLGLLSDDATASERAAMKSE